MNSGIFSSLSSSYFEAGQNVFYYVGNSNWIIRPFSFILAIGFNIILLPVAILFWSLKVFDILGKAVDSIRRVIINMMDNLSDNISNSFFSFILNPLFIVLLSPFFILSLLLPKLSSDVVVGQLSDIGDGAGVFERLNKITSNGAKETFMYVEYSHILFKPFMFIIAILLSFILICLGFLFILFIPLDWISKIVEKIRQFIVDYVDDKKYDIRYDTQAFLFTPILLVMLAPLFILAILIPKFSSSISDVY